MLTLHKRLQRLRDERGFTLIETLVAMVTGLVVTGALFAILEFSVRQASYISQTAQATQVSRTAMTKIIDALHSACLYNGFSPVVGTASAATSSTPMRLIFQNGYSEQAEVPSTFTTKGGSTGAKSEGVRQDTIEWNEAKSYLTDQVALGSGTEEGGKYKVGTATTLRLAERVTPAESANSAKETTKWVFRYYQYAPTSSTATGAAATTLTEIPLKTGGYLTAAEAAKVAAVEVRFKVGSTTKEVKLKAAAEAAIPNELESLTTFAFSAPDSEATIVAGPCE